MTNISALATTNALTDRKLISEAIARAIAISLENKYAVRITESSVTEVNNELGGSRDYRVIVSLHLDPSAPKPT